MLLSKNYSHTISALSELIVITAKNNDIEALGAAFLLRGMTEYYHKEFASACESFMEVV